jgi:uncharacterized protein with NRDE domain
MCLIALAWQAHPDYPLLVAANRDEFYARPTAPARFWSDAPDLLAGRDLREGGTWMGITRQGRFAALTNVRDPAAATGRLSRGLLVADFLRSNTAPLDYLEQVAAQRNDYGGFNLLVGDRRQLAWYNNREGEPLLLQPGVHGLSNKRLDTPWPKVRKLKAGFSTHLGDEPDPEALLQLLADETLAPDAELPDTGIGLPLERLLSACFIRSPQYGTRASTLLMAGPTRARFIEQGFDQGHAGERVDIAFDLEP